MAKKDVAVLDDEQKKALAEMESGGTGFEGQDTSHLTIPIIGVVQGQSKVRDTVEGAKVGDLYDSVSEEMVKHMHFIGGHSEHVYNEWKPRDAGGGFRGTHDPKSDIVTAAIAGTSERFKYSTKYGPGGALKDEDGKRIGNDLIETFNIIGMRLDDDGEIISGAIIPFFSTKIGVYRKWNTRISQHMLGKPDKPKYFQYAFTLTTILVPRDSGDSYNYVITPYGGGSLKDAVLPIDDPRVIEAFKLGKGYRENQIVGDLKGMNEQGGEAQTDGDGVPF